MTLTTYVVRRTLFAIASLLVTTAVIFALLMTGPDPLAQLAQESDVDTAQLRESYGWDRPWIVQYSDWLSSFVGGDWGDSIRTESPARDLILERLPVTLALGLSSLAIALAVSLVLASWSARRKDSTGDRIATGTMIALGALPAFLLAVLLQWCAVQLKDTFGMTIVYVGGMPRDGGVIEYIQRFALPVLVLVLVQVAAWMRFERSQLIDEFESESMQAARARGLPECVLSRRHAMRPTFAPLIALVALELGTLIGGAVVVETIFGLPGIGRLLVDSVQARDVVVVLDIVALGAILMVVVTAVADVVMARLDPRISGPLEGVR